MKSFHPFCLWHRGNKVLVSHRVLGCTQRQGDRSAHARSGVVSTCAGSTANSSALVDEARRPQWRRGAETAGKAAWAHDVGTALEEAGGPGEVARFPSRGLRDLFISTAAGELSGNLEARAVRRAAIMQPQALHRTQGGRGESRGQGSPCSLSARTRKTASSLPCCACLRQGLRVNLHSP